MLYTPRYKLFKKGNFIFVLLTVSAKNMNMRQGFKLIKTVIMKNGLKELHNWFHYRALSQMTYFRNSLYFSHLHNA